MSRVPLLLVGEFDQSVGFNISSVFELFAERRMYTARCAVRARTVVDDRLVVGRNVLCGSLRGTLQTQMHALAARTLCDVSSGYSAILTDPDLGGVACVTFELRDHEARGTRRNCCLLLVVPDEERLVARWHVIGPGLEFLASRWAALALQLFEQETRERDTSSYRTNVQPDRLRGIDELLSPKITPAESAALVEVTLMCTCSVRAQLLASSLVPSPQPQTSDTTFRSPIKHLACPPPPPKGFREMMREQLADAVDRRALCVMTFPVSPEGITSAFHFDSRPTSEVLAPRELVVPLGSLLVRIFRAEFNNFNNFSIKVAPLLSALFCGNQIIVDVHPDCGVSSKSVIASLAEVLPRALRRMQPAATEYLPPNLSRMIAFSPRKEIVVTRETEHFGKDVFALADLADHQDLTVPSIVLLELTPTSAKVSDATQVLRDAGVLEAPRSRECSQRTKRDSDMGPYGPFTKSPLSYATLVNRILVAVKLHCEKTANADADRLPVEESLLQCQIVQTVREYVCRGRLYTKMLRRQKEDEFRVAMAGRQQKQSFASRVLNLFRRASTPAGPEVSKSRRPSAVAVDPEDTLQPLPRYEKQQSGLSAVSRSSRFVSPEESDPNYRPQKSLAVSDLCDVLPADHSILVFLGTAPSPFGPREAED